MKKILLLTLGLIMASWNFVQDAGLPADTLSEGADAQEDARTEFTMAMQEGATKVKGDSAYMQNDYATAIQIYENLLAGKESAEVYYNLGNCYYKSDNLAKAILNYERAWLLQPGNSDIKANLEIARAKTIDKVTPIPDVFFVAWIKSLINCLSVDTWAKWGIVFFLLMIASFCIFLYSKKIVLKKGSFICGVSMLVLTLLANVFAMQQKARLIERNHAIVLSPSITVRSTPSESGTSLFVLHEGHKVEIKDNSMQAWKEIRLEDGKVGWLPASAIEVI